MSQEDRLQQGDEVVVRGRIHKVEEGEGFRNLHVDVGGNMLVIGDHPDRVRRMGGQKEPEVPVHPIVGMSAGDAVDHVNSLASAEELDAAKAAEEGSKSRVTVLRAIEARVEALKAEG